MDWNPIYTSFPVNREMIWLNNCGTTPAGNHILTALSRFMEGYARKGIFTETARFTEVRSNIKNILSRLLNCLPEELALIHNTAEGMNFISHGLKLSAEDEVILLQNEYPSNIYPWRHLEKKGVKLVTTPMETSPDAFLIELKRLITAKTRAISLSAVHWCTGMPLPLEQVGKLCKENNIDFVVDGAQGVGMQPLDTRSANIGYMAFSGWKWLMGPLGVGVLFVSQQKLNTLDPVFIGTASVINDKEYFPYKSELKPTADRFTISTANFNDWVYFEAALEFLQNIGFRTVRERIYELSAYLRDGLAHLGFHVLSDHFQDYPTGIVVCEKPGIATNAVMDHLKNNRVVAAERLGRVRFSPHIYLSLEQMDTVLNLMARM
jgi:cysteine desulfurase / selenocysteine lyase